MSKPVRNNQGTETDHMPPGRWVLVWGQLVDKPAHPEDVVVEFFSHGEQWRGHVRRDRVEPAPTPDFAVQCHSLRQVKPHRYARCEETQNHSGDHRSGRHIWTDHGADGGIDQ